MGRPFIYVYHRLLHQDGFIRLNLICKHMAFAWRSYETAIETLQEPSALLEFLFSTSNSFFKTRRCSEESVSDMLSKTSSVVTGASTDFSKLSVTRPQKEGVVVVLKVGPTQSVAGVVGVGLVGITIDVQLRDGWVVDVVGKHPHLATLGVVSHHHPAGSGLYPPEFATLPSVRRTT